MSESRYRVRLLRWSESSSGGRTVTFQLPDDGDEHPFKGLATGKRDGALLEIEVRAADDPEAPLETLKHGPGAAAAAAQPAAQPAAGPRPRIRRAVRSHSGLGSEQATAGRAADAATPTASPPDADASEAAPASETVPSWRTMFGYPPGSAVTDEAPAGAGHAATTENAVVGDAPEPFEPDAALAMQTMANAALDMRRAAVEIAQDREGRGGGDGDGADDKDGVVQRATMLCQEVDHQRAGFFYYMKTRYPTVPELPSEAGQWSRDSNATRHRVCFHCRTTALAELGLDAKAEGRFEDLEADYERTERSR